MQLSRLCAFSLAAPLMGLALSACTAAGRDSGSVTSSPVGGTPGPTVTPVICKVEDFASFKGQPESMLAATTFPQGLAVRIVKPDQPVTMDFSESRVNFLLDKQGLISEITCG
jgi:Peptidase inhibitor I78 family